MSTFRYYSAPGFGQVARAEYGFSDACIIGNRMEVTGQGTSHSGAEPKIPITNSLCLTLRSWI
jgi:hypothetical protein